MIFKEGVGCIIGVLKLVGVQKQTSNGPIAKQNLVQLCNRVFASLEVCIA